MTALLGGSPAWWLRQDDTMVATGLDVIEQLHRKA